LPQRALSPSAQAIITSARTIYQVGVTTDDIRSESGRKKSHLGGLGGYGFLLGGLFLQPPLQFGFIPELGLIDLIHELLQLLGMSFHVDFRSGDPDLTDLKILGCCGFSDSAG
jgi:hypothetical protein